MSHHKGKNMEDEKMEPITITQGDQILAHHTTGTPMSHYGQPVWVVEESDPDPGRAEWK